MLFASFFPAGAAAQCKYNAQILDYPINCGLGYAITVGLGLNEQGVVVGRYKCALWEHDEGFRWTPPNSYMTLPRPPGVESLEAVDINEAGEIAGTYVDETGFKGFVYQSKSDQYTELPPLQGPYSWASAIDNAGRVVGARTIRFDTAPYNGFIWSSASGFADLGVMEGPYSFAVDIAESGAVTGWTGNGLSTNSNAFLSQHEQVTLLGPIPGGFTSKPWAISDGGAIVGSGLIPLKGSPTGVNRAFLWIDGSYTMLGTLPGHIRSRAEGISPHGRQIVGDSGFGRGFLWQDGVMRDLNDLAQSPPGFVILEATAVNNAGLTVALARAPGGEIVTFVLTPLDQPTGDLDNDCRVGIVDLLMLLAEWGMTNSRADFDGDGQVGPLDFATLLENWTP